MNIAIDSVVNHSLFSVLCKYFNKQRKENGRKTNLAEAAKSRARTIRILMKTIVVAKAQKFIVYAILGRFIAMVLQFMIPVIGVICVWKT